MPPVPRGVVHLAAMAAIVLTPGIAPDAASQVVAVTESPLRPLVAGRDPSSAPVASTSYYVALLPLDPEATTGVERAAATADFQFPATRIVISVASAPLTSIADNSSGRAAWEEGALEHLNVHITASALDARGEVLSGAAGKAPLTVLEIAPSEATFGAEVGDVVGTAASLATTALERLTGPLWAVVRAFHSSFHRRPPPTQIAYVSSPHAFGWRWYKSADHPIEGLHNTAVLFQVPSEAKSLAIAVDVVAHWRVHGPWVKTYRFVYELGDRQ